MQFTLVAFAAACAFIGAALYINIVEQPARLGLEPRAIMREWLTSNRRGFILMTALAVISALAGYTHYLRSGDVRSLIGATIILVSWPYAYFVMTPVNILIHGLRRDAAGSPIRKLMRDWGLLEWGQTAIGLAAACMFGWMIAFPP